MQGKHVCGTAGECNRQLAGDLRTLSGLSAQMADVIDQAEAERTPVNVDSLGGLITALDSLTGNLRENLAARRAIESLGCFGSGVITVTVDSPMGACDCGDTPPADAGRLAVAPSLRWLIRRDMPEVLAIEQATYSPAEAWTFENFFEVLAHRNAEGLVIELPIEGVLRVVGYVVFTRRREEIDIETLVVHPRYRRRGLGRFVIGYLIPKLSRRRQFLNFLVDERNVESHLFLKAVGFRCTGIEEGAFGEEGEISDGMAFEYRWQPGGESRGAGSGKEPA